MDVVALPTYREGFPNVPREAGASGIPTVATTATGSIDSVVDGGTGLLVPPRDEIALAAALKELLEDPEKRRQMGRAGEEWVRARFRQDLVWDALIADYKKVVRETVTSRGFRGTIKAAMDPIAAGLLLILFSPVLAVLGLLLQLQTERPH